MDELAASNVILLNNGCDHLEAQPEIPEIIRKANAKLEDADSPAIPLAEVKRELGF